MKVGFFCAGAMGLPMVRCLVAAGFEVAVWNRTLAKVAGLADDGVRVCRTPVEVAEDMESGDVMVLMASDSVVCDSLLFGDDGEGGDDGIVKVAKRGAIVVVCTSATPLQAKAQAERCAALGLGYADAPVSGGEQGAIDGKLSVMVGADDEVYKTIVPMLRAFGNPILIGAVGCGQLAKLANQAIVGTTIAAVAEALLLAERCGASPAAVREALLGGFANSKILQSHGARMIDGDIEPGGAAKYQLRDLQNAIAAGEGVGLPMLCTQSAASLFDKMIKNGMGEKDHSALHNFLSRNP